MSDFRSRRLAAARAKIAVLERDGRADSESLPFDDPAVDLAFPGGGGLPLGRWHELAGEGLDSETAAAPAAFAALLAAPLARRGAAVWVQRCDDLHAPGLAGLGFPPARLIQVAARDEAEVLAVMEDALSTAGVACVFGEVEGVDLVAGRRLQLACERRGATGFVIRRKPFGGVPRGAVQGAGAATRWRVAAAPSVPALGEFGLGPPRWRAALERCRGGRPGEWLFEAAGAYGEMLLGEVKDGTHPLRVVAQLGDRELAPSPLRAVG
jgi:protein ImuA